ncbi:aminomethyl-transferring glycine dehydrogenase subunit GcvPA [Halarsenatibacter silvermanii]|uniref:Probable glycine dehydrogenase (decarboxylating) subunit 1 n=1 Tax=Halarsenatibacter silvermanii TaxID=321763 RepID=A0A1G9Q6I0_9FIRM|nr:aminomethyl-transferring glycine dehydrogenase subunit GcvPA [Halarsenatibacter silvermanii]SDM05955.1 glycine dehydrogenase (decarboxylating) alpha subunit [Halarsenatibacter silvermanii]
MSNISYISNTDREREEMLSAIGAEDVEELFSAIPEEVMLDRPFEIPEGMSEMELVELAQEKAERNLSLGEIDSYLGAGSYDHYLPAIIDHLVLRQEFYTSYTPYQAELSQGTLQTIYEYQSMICELTGMGISNASLLDGGSAVGEAVLMAARFTRSDKVVLSSTVHPAYRRVARTYGYPQDIDFNEIEMHEEEPVVKVDEIIDAVDAETAAVVVQYPNFFGAIEDIEKLNDALEDSDTQLIVVANPIALGMLTPPGELGADIAVGEAQPLGNVVNYGGPYLGYLAIRDDRRLLRKMPGRLSGRTTDDEGNEGFVMTMQTREQHIRRERATSNICTNENLNVVMAAIYMGAMGKQGLQDVADHCYQKTRYLKDQLAELEGVEIVNGDNHFHEFWMKTDKSAAEIEKGMIERGILPGVDLSQFGEVEGLLVNVTEKKYKEDLDNYVSTLEVVLQ